MRPPNTYAWEEAPPEAREAWRRCAAHHYPGGAPPARFACGGWVFVLADNGKRYYPALPGTHHPDPEIAHPTP